MLDRHLRHCMLAVIGFAGMAIAAGTASMIAVEGRGAEPAGTYSPTAVSGTLSRSHSTPGAVSMRSGGAQAVAAMAYGCAPVPKCDKIFGPGNAWVAAAKMIVAGDPAGAAADLPAGVSEVLVVADDGARADFVAADLLAQAEHSVDAQALLVTDSAALAHAAVAEVERQRRGLRRGAILDQSIGHMRAIIVDSLAEAFDLANAYAPEHLILEIREPRAWLHRVTAAGAVFLGSWSPESIGDYCAGPNHTLPTYGYARAYSGLSLEDFQKRITVQELTPAGLRSLGPTAQVLAGLEGLDAHAAAVTVRLAALEGMRR